MQVGAALNDFMTRTVHLPSHLAAIEHFVLLGRGDVCRAFLAAAADLLRTPPRAATAARDVRRPWASAAVRARADASPCFEHVAITWAAAAPRVQTGASSDAHLPAFSAARPGAPPTWNGVHLTYTPPWPLPLLFDAAALSLYRCAALHVTLQCAEPAPTAANSNV